MRRWTRWRWMVVSNTGTRRGEKGTGGRRRITMAVAEGTGTERRIRTTGGGRKMIASIGTGIGRGAGIGRETGIRIASTGTGIRNQSVTAVASVTEARIVSGN
uniref:DOT2 n=1 Tax=Arundo donax TaxID=35708 RepID=A0A0A9G926_ARUDO